MPVTLEVGYFNSYYAKRIADQPVGDGTTVGTWNSPPTETLQEDWYIEESRIRGGYNNTSTDLGVKAYIVEDNDDQQRLSNSMIYSGVLNSRTGVNQTNQFSVAEDITKSVDPINGSIQKLYAENTNLIIFQERKVSRALIDKDAIYSAEGAPVQTVSNVVIGQVQAYAGEFGISRNPESFAVYGYQKYFTDKDRNAVLRLSMDGITEISAYGMSDFFRDKLSDATSDSIILGSYDVHNKNYVLSIKQYPVLESSPYVTLSFDEAVKGWTSFYTYSPDVGFSSQGEYFTTKGFKVYKHYSDTDNRNRFYGVDNKSIIKFVINPDPTIVKTMLTINYEGTNGWEVTSLNSDDTGFDLSGSTWNTHVDTIIGGTGVNDYRKIYSYDEGAYSDNNIQYRAGFDRKQNRYVAVIPNNTQTPIAGEVLFGKSMTGIRAYYANVTMQTDDTTDPRGLKELFAVGSTYNI